jgi:hypothetical protein
MRNLLLTAALSVIIVTAVSAQGEIVDLTQTVFYRNERTFGIILNTDGYALGYREGKRINFLNKRLYEIEMGILKHPREVKLSNPYFQSGSTFVFGKLNCASYLRVGFGNQHELFSKEDLGGVAIRYFWTAGPGLVVYKPIYYEILHPLPSPNEFEIKEEKFNAATHDPSLTYGKASFAKGFNEIGVIPGVYGKFGFNFEYSKEDKVIHSIEIGTSFSAFPRKVPIMAVEDNKAIFLSPFVSYRMGLIIDPLDPKSNRMSTIFIRNR